MNTSTIDYLTQDELKQLLKAINNKRDKAITLSGTLTVSSSAVQILFY